MGMEEIKRQYEEYVKRRPVSKEKDIPPEIIMNQRKKKKQK